MKLAYEAAHKVLPVGGAAARAHQVQHALAVQRGRAHIVEHDGRIGALHQAGRIVVVTKAEHLDVVFFDEQQLLLSPCQGEAPVFQCLGQPLAAVGQHVANVVAVFVDGTPASQLLIEQQGRGKVESRHAGQRQGIEDLLFVHRMYFSKARS